MRAFVALRGCRGCGLVSSSLARLVQRSCLPLRSIGVGVVLNLALYSNVLGVGVVLKLALYSNVLGVGVGLKGSLAFVRLG